MYYPRVGMRGGSKPFADFTATRLREFVQGKEIYYAGKGGSKLVNLDVQLNRSFNSMLSPSFSLVSYFRVRLELDGDSELVSVYNASVQNETLTFTSYDTPEVRRLLDRQAILYVEPLRRGQSIPDQDVRLRRAGMLASV